MVCLSRTIGFISLLIYKDLLLLSVTFILQDIGLKTGILELLSVCVDTQPGLIEVFLNVQTAQSTDPSKVPLSSR